jgi:hypothetical protein
VNFSYFFCQSVWDLQYHPVGHIVCSGSNDHTTKFWARARPADTTKDINYNVQTHQQQKASSYADMEDGYSETSSATNDQSYRPTPTSGPGLFPGPPSIPGVGQHRPLSGSVKTEKDYNRQPPQPNKPRQAQQAPIPSQPPPFPFPPPHLMPPPGRMPPPMPPGMPPPPFMPPGARPPMPGFPPFAQQQQHPPK